MLILTDRPTEVDHFRKALSTIAPCIVARTSQDTTVSSRMLVVCDMDFGDAEARVGLRAVLDRSRDDDAPLLCLLRDPSHLTFTLARELGATAVLSGQTPPAELASRVRLMLASRSTGSGVRPDEELSRDVGTAGAALREIFAAAQDRRPVSAKILDAGAVAALAGVKPTVEPWLDIVRRHDDVTYQHCLLVTGLAAAFAVRIGLSRDCQRLLAQAALVHDIGKAAIPTAILNKPGQLTVAELAVMQTHPARGQEILGRQSDIDPCILDIVRHHHEYLDGSGYPDGLRGAGLSALVRAVTICDIYAALIERRPYKQPMEPSSAFAMLEQMGTKLDLGLLALFREMIAAPERNGRIF